MFVRTDLDGLSPGEVIARWPASERLCACVSGELASGWSRWSVLTRPHFVREIPFEGLDPSEPLRALREALGSTRSGDGGWMVALSYDLGRLLEPRAQAECGAVDDRGAPAMILVRYEGALVHDAETGTWATQGDADAIPELQGAAREMGFVCGGLQSRTGREGFERSVAECVELIHAGDAFQVNLAHRLTGRYEGEARGLFRSCVEGARAWYGAIIESDARTIVSMSPELFLSFDGLSRRVVTRPIKGTRPSGRAGELVSSQKDSAELVMIVDLMRNDIGRVCEIGSVRVIEGRALEHHAGEEGGVVHGVATVEGILSDGRDEMDLLGATFPPGSVTGAPKVRAMQIIDMMEPVRRGFYCGSIGMITDGGDAVFSVAIRTATLTHESDRTGVLDYSVGAGIVAESDPNAEWEETLHKSEAFLSALSRCAPKTIGSGS